MRHANSTASGSLIKAFLCAASLCLPCVTAASSSIDICQEPLSENQLAIAYYDQQRSPFERGPGATNRLQYSTDLLLNPGERWAAGFGYRGTILNVDDLALQTNGYLHTFFFPVHRNIHDDGNSLRLSVAPALSGSSNVVKDPDEYSRDAVQLLAAMIWKRPVYDQLSVSYGICGDYRLGGFQLYPTVAFSWQPRPDWRVELGFPTSRLTYQATDTVNFWLRVTPDGNEWYVKSRNLEKASRLVYEAYRVESALGWRLHQDFTLTASIGREFNGVYEMTLVDDSRVRLSSRSATRFGLALAWYF